MAIAILEPFHYFGLNIFVANNISFYDDQTLVYPSGTSLVLYNIDIKTQRFILGSAKSLHMSALAISPSRRYAAVAEKDEKALINIYDIQLLRKRKMLSHAELQAKEFVSISFSPDSKQLIALSGAPDWALILWGWEKAKLITVYKLTNLQVIGTLEVYQVIYHPKEINLVAVIGYGFTKVFRFSEGNLKPWGGQKAEGQHNCLCITWLGEDRLMVGTDQGKLLVLQGGEIKQEFNLNESPTKGTLTPVSINASHSASDKGDIVLQNKPVTSIVSYTKGFACAFGMGTVLLFEVDENEPIFKKTREVRIPQDAMLGDDTDFSEQVISCLTVSPGGELLVASTNKHQLFQCPVSVADVSRGENYKFEYLGQPFHFGPIIGMDTCIRKPLIVTSSTDKTVRLWNFETCSLEQYKEFQEEVLGVAIHPSGLHILVGFNNKLLLMNLLSDDIRTFKEFNIKGVKECSFSRGGHLFVAVHNNIIQLFSTVTFESVSTFKGHTGKVNSVCWTQDDSKIISCGADGAVYEWEISTNKRVGECVIKVCSYNCVTVSPDGKNTIAVGSDKTIKEISDSQILHDIPAKGSLLTAVLLSHSGRLLFTSNKAGSIQCIQFPLSKNGEWRENQAHTDAINKIKITFGDQYLVAISDDSCISVWKIIDSEMIGIKREREIPYSKEILITRKEILEKLGHIRELQTTVEELKSEKEHQLRLKDMTYNDKIKEITEKFIQEMETLKTKNQVLRAEIDNETLQHKDKMDSMMTNHSKQVAKIEAAHDHQLLLEYKKYDDSLDLISLIEDKHKQELEGLKQSKYAAHKITIDKYENKARELQTQIRQLQEELDSVKKEGMELRKQMEIDVDREILDLKSKYEQRLHDEKETNVRLKGEGGIMRKRFLSLQKDMDEYKIEIQRMQAEQNKLNTIIKTLEKDIYSLKREIQERDDTIQEKEKRIFDLKRKTQELEKFKFVLDYKIKELKKQLEPKDNLIKFMKEQIQEMEGELKRFHKQNTQLELNIIELQRKLNCSDRELDEQKQRAHEIQILMDRLKSDLVGCIAVIQDPKKLKENVKSLYQKHVQTPDNAATTVFIESNIQLEFARQREHLEKSMTTLRTHLIKDAALHKGIYVKVMQENVMLIKEINELRYELNLCRHKIKHLELRIQLIPGELSKENQKVVEEKIKLIATQKADLKKLRTELREYELAPSGSPSLNVLPPVKV